MKVHSMDALSPHSHVSSCLGRPRCRASRQCARMAPRLHACATFAANNKLPNTFSTVARQAAAAALAAVFAMTTADTPAVAALLNPNTRLPRTGEVALRRSVPVVNKETGELQSSLEEVLYLLRIPQRKPWGSMAGSVEACKRIVAGERENILAAVPSGAKRDSAAATLAGLTAKLDSVLAALAATDADATASRISTVLNDVAALELAQAPGLPYLLPAQYASRPRLSGRAVAEVTVERRDGSTFEAMSDGRGPQRTGKMLVVLDGYNAPLTAGNWAALARRGFFTGTALQALPADEAVMALPPKDSPLPLKTVPLEMRPQDEFEPRYRVPLNVQDGDSLPVLPLSVYGAVAMAKNGSDSDGSQWFMYRYARRTAGLGGLAFEEGSYSVFGYVVDGLDLLRQLRSGDVVKEVRLVEGAENLVEQALPAAEGPLTIRAS